jgi:hypothetical protein
MTHAITASPALWLLLGLALFAGYLLPTAVAIIRRADHLLLVFLVNLIGGATLIGWPAALLLATGLPRRPPPDLPRYLPPPPPPVRDAPLHALLLTADKHDPDSFSRAGR